MRVTFFQSSPFHEAILRPPYEQFRGQAEVSYVTSLTDLKSQRPKVLFYAESVPQSVRRALPDCVYIWTRHGFSSKNYLKRCLMRCDIAMVSSPWVRAENERRYVSPYLGYWETGFIPMDACWRQWQRRKQGNKGNRRVLLYAPTFGAGLSAHPVIGSAWMESFISARPDILIRIKPHPHTQQRHPDWLASWRAMRARFPEHIDLAPGNANIYELMADSDCLLTDVSSVMFYYLAIDKPLVLIDSPHARGDRRFDPTGPEWRWRDMGARVRHRAHLPGELRSALDEPARRAATRAIYRRRVFGETFDGRAVERTLERLDALIDRLDDASMLRLPRRRHRGLLRRQWMLCRPHLFRGRREATCPGQA